jgi:TPR repeat protein
MAFQAEEESLLWTAPWLAAESHRAAGDFDSLEAFQAWCEETAHHHYVEGLNSLGLYFLKDSQEEKAMEHFRSAAELGSFSAQETLANCLRKSEFRQAAYQGDAYAQYQLGVMLLWEGQYEECATFFSLSASQGDSDAQVALGVCLEFGKGIPEDLTLAQWYYSLAAHQGNEDAFECLSRVQKKLADECAEWFEELVEEGVGNATEENLLEGGSKSTSWSESSTKLAEPVRFLVEI